VNWGGQEERNQALNPLVDFADDIEFEAQSPLPGEANQGLPSFGENQVKKLLLLLLLSFFFLLLLLLFKELFYSHLHLDLFKHFSMS